MRLGIVGLPHWDAYCVPVRPRIDFNVVVANRTFVQAKDLAKRRARAATERTLDELIGCRREDSRSA
jgi:hypothetical protein